MSLRRIIGVLWQELFVLYRSGEVISDIFVLPFANIIVFGYISLYLSGVHSETGKLVLLGMLLWQIIWIVEYSVTLGSLWNIWSRNLTNLFITPMRLDEYILAHTISGVIKAVMILLLSTIVSIYAFNFNPFSIGLAAIALVFVNFTLFAYALGIALLGFIFRYGTRIQAVAWATVSFFQPLSAAFYPLAVMPKAVQYMAVLFPATHTFEAARYALLNHGDIAWNLFGISFVENIFYCILCTILFRYLYNASRDTGQFARNES